MSKKQGQGRIEAIIVVAKIIPLRGSRAPFDAIATFDARQGPEQYMVGSISERAGFKIHRTCGLGKPVRFATGFCLVTPIR